MMKYLILIIGFCSLQLSGIAQYSGTVFIDENGNEQFDEGEKARQGVLVSNGEQVVKTDARGRYTLPPSDRDRFIFITTPSGFRCRQFYKANHGQADPYDFALREVPVADAFSFIHISDTETSDSTLWVEMLREYGRQQEPAFIIHTGDICYENGMRFHAAQVNTQTMGLPVYYTVGNHDLVASDYGEQLYEELFGPVYYSFDVGNVHFIVTPMPSGDYRPQYTQEDVYRWLKNDLAQVPKDRPKVIFNHDLLRSEEGFVFRIDEEQFIDLEDHSLKAWVYGHWHNHFYRRHEDSEVISICTAVPNKGGIDHSLSAFRIFNMQQDGSFTTELIHSYVDHELTIAAPAPLTQLSPEGELPILVNAYNSTAPVQQMQYSFENGKARPLQQVSNWSWQGSLSLRKQSAHSGAYHLSVSGTFADGVTLRKERDFQIREFAGQAAEGHWPNFLFNARRSPENTDTIASPLQLDWVTNVGANIYHCSPIVADGKVYMASIDDGDARNCGVYAYDVATGNLQWKAPTRNSVKHAIAYADGLVLAADQIGYLYAFDAKSGKLKWELDLELNILPSYVSGLVVSDGVVYAGDGRNFSAVSIKDGKRRWRNEKWPQGEGSPSPPSVAEGVVIASSNWRHLYAFDASSGEPLWNNTEHGLRFRNAAPVYADGHFYTTSSDALFRIIPKTGKVALMAETSYNLNASSSPAFYEDLLIVGTGDAGIRAFNRHTFAEVWDFETQPALSTSVPYAGPRVRTVAATPVVSGDQVYVGGLDGHFYCLDARSGALQWSLDLGAPIFSTVAITEGRIYLSDLGGNLYAFSAGDK